MTADSSTANVTHSSDGGGSGVSSPTGRIMLRSPWSQVVRSEIEPDLISEIPAVSDPVSPAAAVDAPAVAAETQPEGAGGGDSCNVGDVVKSVWNKPLDNGDVEGRVSPVMGAELWPDLSESTRSGVKLSSVSAESSAKLTVDVSAAVSQAPVISQPPQKQSKPNSNTHHNQNHGRQRPNRRGGSVGGASVGYNRPPGPPPPPPLPPPFPLIDVYGNLVPTVTEFPQPSFQSTNWSPRSDRTLNRNPARRNNFDPRPFGYGGRRDHHGPRSPATRDVHMPHQMGPPPVRGFVRPPFIPQPLRPYGAPMGYEMGASYVYVPALAPELYRGGAPFLSYGASGSSMFIPYWDSSLHGSIIRQIEYYFSDENLVKDNFLRSHMDDEGWVPITLIAGFQRVQKLTNDLQMILSTLTYSNTVEVQGDKVRRRTDWKRWIHIPREAIAKEASLKNLTLDEGPANEKQVLGNGEASCDVPCS